MLTIFIGACMVATVGSAPTHRYLIGNHFVFAPNGVSFVADDSTAFVIDPGGDYFAGTAAPDNSYHLTRFYVGDASVAFEWGLVQNAIVGKFSSDKPTHVTLKTLQAWPDYHASYTGVAGGVDASGASPKGEVAWKLRSQPAPLLTSKDEIVLNVTPSEPARLVAGFGSLPTFGRIDSTLRAASRKYAQRRPSASGDWDDFLGAISDNLNNSRVYSSDDHRVAITVSRRWAQDANNAPYFCWDSFFNGALSCLDDPAIARDTVRAILSWQTPEGLVPNFGHWKFDASRASNDRSQPPVGSMCVWKMEQRWPDKSFLREVFPKLLKWHRWWPTARDGKHDGLLEWGSSAAGEQGARWETGWDDTPHFDGSHMVGNTLNAYAVDLNSMWAMDADYLARMADLLGERKTASDLRAEREHTLQLINDKLWNPEMGIYCSRLWDGPFLTRLTPMNFYPLLAGAANSERANRVLSVMTDPKRFWGKWILPTVPYNDPVWPQQDYWRGKVWAPVNFLVFQGLLNYAPASLINEYADKSARLFMSNWVAKGVCGENYLSSAGIQSSDPHYTWGALLCLIGLESVCGIEADGRVRLNGTVEKTLTLTNVPIHGRLYEVRTKPGHAELLRNGEVVLSADGEVVKANVSQ